MPLFIDSKVNNCFNIGGLCCRHVGVQNKRKFAHIVCIKMELSEEKNLIVPVHQHGRHDATCCPIKP